MGNPDHKLRGRGPLGVGATHALDGRWSPECSVEHRPPSSTAPQTTNYFHVWFGWVDGRPVLFEYEPQTHWFWGAQIHEPYMRKQELSFKPAKNRSWYEVGDLVLHWEMDERRLIRDYPELAPPPGEEDSVLTTLAMGFLLGPPDDYKVSYKITKITPSSDGDGKIELTPVLVLDDKTFIELDRQEVRTQLQLNGWWTISLSMGALLAVMKPVVKFYYEAAWALASGGASTAARSGGRQAILFTLRQARRRIATRILARKIVTGLAKDSTKATLAATQSFAKTFAKTYEDESKKQGFANQSGKELDRHAFDVALTKAAGAFVATFITQLLNMQLEGGLKGSGYSEIEKELTKRIVQAFGTNIPSYFTKAIADAWAAEQQVPGTFADNLGKALIKELKGGFTSIVSIDFKNVGQSLAN